MNGIFAIRKPVGPSSQDCVGKLKHILTNSKHFDKDPNKKRKHQFIKIGHGGTLDPLADGVLVIGVGTGTKQLQKYLGACEKVYTATCLFGCSTTTYDAEGSVLGWSKVDELNDERVSSALDKFRGKIQQIPPVFSAIKMDGMHLYDYARQGKALPRPIDSRECEIHEISATPLSMEHDYKFPTTTATDKEIEFAQSVTGEDLSGGEPLTKGPCIDIKFRVSSGTYIRSLVHDLARELGAQAHMVRLTRDRQAEWILAQNTLEMEIFDKSDDEWYPQLMNVLTSGVDWRKTPVNAGESGSVRASSSGEESAKASSSGEESAKSSSSGEKSAKASSSGGPVRASSSGEESAKSSSSGEKSAKASSSGGPVRASSSGEESAKSSSSGEPKPTKDQGPTCNGELPPAKKARTE